MKAFKILNAIGGILSILFIICLLIHFVWDPLDNNIIMNSGYVFLILSYSLLPLHKLFRIIQSKNNDQLIFAKHFSKRNKNAFYIFILINCLFLSVLLIESQYPETIPHAFFIFFSLISVISSYMILLSSSKLGHIELYEHSFFICDSNYYNAIKLDLPEDFQSIIIDKDHLIVKPVVEKIIEPINKIAWGKKGIEYKVPLNNIKEKDLQTLKTFLLHAELV